jgi:TetR/AcrR family transcriptional repressor of nem operon
MSTKVSSRERLLDAADALIYARGYEAVGVAELCKTAGVNKGSFYHFFESKQALVLELIDRSWERMDATIMAMSLDNQSLSGLEAIEQYGELLASGLEEMQAETEIVAGCFFGNLTTEMSTRDEEVRISLAEVFTQMVDAASGAIRRGMDSGDLPKDTDIASGANNVVAQMAGLMVLAKARQDPQILRKLGPTMRRLLT